MPEHRPPYLSASRLALYDRCPAAYAERYVLKLPEQPGWEQWLGKAVHAGLEAHYNGQDYELAYIRYWYNAKKLLAEAGVSMPDAGLSRGLELIEMVRELGLVGIPERHFWMIIPGINIPFTGLLDLSNDHEVWDFKMAAFKLAADKADREPFQPVLYSLAHADHYGEYPDRFMFCGLPRNAGGLQLVDGTRTPEQIEATLDRIREIHRLIEDQQFGCTCKKHQEGVA